MPSRTCQARNAYASDNSTIDIEVNVPPKWTIEPKNAQVILGRSITINCQAEGFPKPKVIVIVVIIAKSKIFDLSRSPGESPSAVSSLPLPHCCQQRQQLR